MLVSPHVRVCESHLPMLCSMDLTYVMLTFEMHTSKRQVHKGITLFVAQSLDWRMLGRLH